MSAPRRHHLVRKGALRSISRSRSRRGKAPVIPAGAITLDHLLRHTAGLALGSSLQASLASALEPVNRMKFMESTWRPMPRACRSKPRRAVAWNYHDGNTIILVASDP